jgi:hypothetical protein
MAMLWAGRLDYCKDDQMKEDEMGWSSGTHGKDEKCIKNFCRRTKYFQSDFTAYIF